MKTALAMLTALVVGVSSMACAHANGIEPPPVAPIQEAPARAGTVDLNSATEPDLVELPLIGPAKAAAIVAYRTRHGAFAKVDDLRKVKGFGRKTIARLKPFLRVDPVPVH